MNFLSPPEEGTHKNAAMADKQLDIAVAFIKELRELRVLAPQETWEEPIKTTAPLFTIPKEGQINQWQVIAYMLRGGQNQTIGADPTILPQQTHILDQTYEGGYSAVVDTSKCFYQFSAHPAD